ncbi:MAG: MFS transporter [Nanoarchaeota archaeon]
MTRLTFGHFQLFHLRLDKELKKLYLTLLLRSVAFTFTGLFVPIYIFTLGYGIKGVMLYYIILYLTHILLMYGAAKFACRFGLKHAMLVSLPFLIGTYMCLNFLPQSMLFLFLAPILGGFHDAYFWTSFHIDFALSSHHEKRGKEVGYLEVMGRILRALGPLLGGIAIVLFGFSALFYAVILFVLLSGIPLVLSKDRHIPIRLQLRHIFHGQPRRHALAYMGYGIDHGTLMIVWPLLIYGIVSEFHIIGLISTLALIAGIVLTIKISQLLDKYKRTRILKIGSVGFAVVWFVRIIAKSGFHIFLIDTIDSLFQPMVHVSVQTVSYDSAKHRLVRYILFREFFLNMGFLAILVFLFFVPSLYLGIIIAALACFLLFFF